MGDNTAQTIRETGKRVNMMYAGRPLTVFNQKSPLWTHLYDDIVPQKATLTSAGCGIFSVCHCGQWLTGRAYSPDDLADFSLDNGGRGDDGTDRPALLSAMMNKGLAREYGFSYAHDGLRNDLPALYHHLLNHRGAALCNLRVGHIVALIAARERAGEIQALALDCASESLKEAVSPHVREVIPGSEVVTLTRNAAGVVVGCQTQYALYWVNAAIARDFNLLHAI